MRDIEIVVLLRLLWQNKKILLRNCVIAFGLALIVAFSIPKEYTAKVILAPEMSGGMSGLSSNLGTWASMAGINMSNLSSNEAIFPDLYPEIVSSTPFLMEMMEVRVETLDGEVKANMYDYLDLYQKSPWWSCITTVPLSFFRSLVDGSKEKENEIELSKATSFQLSEKQMTLLSVLEKSIGVEIDKMTGLITVSAALQDPLVAATVAQALSSKLQGYVEKYRTAKARKDLQYIERLYKESQSNYYKAQTAYANFVDAHQSLFFESVKAEQEKLENEMSLAYNTYSQMAQQLDMAKAKVQEKTPVCVEVQPAVVPQQASAPKKMMTAFIFVFLAFFGTSSWIILKERLFKR